MIIPCEVEEGIDKLRALFPDNTIVAALDLVDRDNGCSLTSLVVAPSVLKYRTPWGRCHYEVLGSTATYSVFPRLGCSTNVSSYCTCPAFAFAVLMSESHLMCKHVLAVCLAEQLLGCVERPISDQDLLARLTAHVP
ncbi:hypothetical protein BU15DRAFT_87128 [Melanogaster broomeanus]|nr:hypothetical protein BU15DRAFT_87128 [Melanogaster broomeanus]